MLRPETVAFSFNKPSHSFELVSDYLVNMGALLSNRSKYASELSFVDKEIASLVHLQVENSTQDLEQVINGLIST